MYCTLLVFPKGRFCDPMKSLIFYLMNNFNYFKAYATVLIPFLFFFSHFFLRFYLSIIHIVINLISIMTIFECIKKTCKSPKIINSTPNYSNAFINTQATKQKTYLREYLCTLNWIKQAMTMHSEYVIRGAMHNEIMLITKEYFMGILQML